MISCESPPLPAMESDLRLARAALPFSHSAFASSLWKRLVPSLTSLVYVTSNSFSHLRREHGRTSPEADAAPSLHAAPEARTRGPAWTPLVHPGGKEAQVPLAHQQRGLLECRAQGPTHWHKQALEWLSEDMPVLCPGGRELLVQPGQESSLGVTETKRGSKWGPRPASPRFRSAPWLSPRMSPASSAQRTPR